jgi:hypothetical protein
MCKMIMSTPLKTVTLMMDLILQCRKSLIGKDIKSLVHMHAISLVLFSLLCFHIHFFLK